MLKVNPRLLAIIPLDEKDDFLNDAKEVFPADVNHLLVRKSLPAPALKSLRIY